MSAEPDITKPPIDPVEFHDQASKLLREYSEKLLGIADKSTQIASANLPNSKWDSKSDPTLLRLKERLHHLVPPCTELIRQVSGMVEHGKLTDLQRVGLWLLLSEMEVAFRQAKEAIFGTQQPAPANASPLLKTLRDYIAVK